MTDADRVIRTGSPQTVVRHHARQELGLPPVAGMAHLHDLCRSREPPRRFFRVVSYGDEGGRIQKPDQLLEQVLTGAAFRGDMRSIAEGMVRQVGMEGKDVPEEDRRPDAGQYAPHDPGGAFPDRGALGCASKGQPPSLRVFVQMLVVGERQAGSPAAEVTVVPAGRSE